MTGSASFAPIVTFDQTLEDAFPNVDPGCAPMGSRVVVQIRSPKKKTAGGIILPDEVQDTINWNTQTAVVRAIGPLAFKNRTTQEPWPEGAWCVVRDYVRVPKYGGDRFEVPLRDKQGNQTGEVALFVILNDMDLIAKITCDPREVVAFV